MKKPYRNIYFNDERKWKSTHHTDDVLQVGKQKAIGYILATPYPCEQKCSLSELNEIENTLKNNETKLVCRYKPNHSLHDTYLYVGDKNMIQIIIDQNKSILDDFKWICDVQFVFDKIVQSQVYHFKNEKLFHFICNLFNSWCLFCEDKIWKGKEVFSVNPYDPDLDIDCC